MGFRPDSIKSWLRAVLADGESLKRSGYGIIGYTPASTTGTETLTNKTLTCLCKCYYRWCSSCSFCICDNCWLSTFHNGYTAVCCS